MAHPGRPATLSMATVVLLSVAGVAHAQRGGRGGGSDSLEWRFLGPAVGNRISAIAGISGDPFTYYAGAASGGIWRTTDGGGRWTPIFDAQPVTAIGALAVSPADTSTIWAGTGESCVIRESDVMGDGVYRSSDAGRTWTNVGLPETGRITRILAHPTDPNTAYVCALGRTTGPQKERGVFKTTDGGKSWDHVLFVDENTGCSGISMDAKNPRKLVVGTWQVEMHPWAMFSGGPGSGVYTTSDGGAKWTRVEHPALPKKPGKIDVAIAPSDSNRVYALIQTNDEGSLWRSDDGGTNWRVASWNRALVGRAGYYLHLRVAPDNANEVLVANSSFWVSVDGGETFRETPMGGDTHDIWIDPKNADRYVVTHDLGLNITEQRARSSKRVTLPIGQMYHVAVDNEVPYRVYSNMQDNGTMRGRINDPEGGFGGRGVWDHFLGGCESGFTIPDPGNSDIVWATCYGNKITRYDTRTGRARSVAPSLISLDSPPNDAKYRCHWSAPIAVDPFDSNNVWYGCQLILATNNGGQSWRELSGDLSTKDPSRVIPSGGIVGDNLGQFYGEVVFAIAFSKIKQGLAWVGTNDGKVWNTQDGGKTWNDLTRAIVGMPAWGLVSKIEPSHHDPGTAYVAVAAHLMDDRTPYIFKTADYGKSWTRISGDLPSKHPLNYVRAIAESPARRGLLYAGTGKGFFYSLNDGVNWTSLQAGLPTAPVTWIETQANFHDVVVSTYGRGLYALDDVSALEQMSVAGPAAETKLYKPRANYRFGQEGRVTFAYSLKAAAGGAVRFEISGPDGKTIRELNGAGRAGLNRVNWDMRYTAPRVVALRTTPVENPRIWEEIRFRGADTRPVTHWGLAQAQVGPIVAPGTYTVKMTVGSETRTETFEVKKDPKVATTDAEFQKAVATQLRIRDAINQTSDIVNHFEVMRKQLEDVEKAYRNDRSRAALVKAVVDMNRKMQGIEGKLLEPAQWLSDDKYFQQAYRVYMNLIWLNGETGPGAGDVAGGADFGPTDTTLALLADLEKELASVNVEYQALLKNELPAFNQTLATLGASGLPGH